MEVPLFVCAFSATQSRNEAAEVARPLALELSVEQKSHASTDLGAHCLIKQGHNTTESGLGRRMKFVEDLKRLREEALAELEKQGYAVRGRTTSEIRDAIKRKPRSRSK